jgi:hypothetical protein
MTNQTIPPCPLCKSFSPVIIRRENTQYVTVTGQHAYKRADQFCDWDKDAICNRCGQVRPDLFVDGLGCVHIKEPT